MQHMKTECRVCKLLIADDAAEVASRLTNAFAELKGVEIAGPVRDGEEALRVFEAEQPDAVILDVQMPPRGGIYVLRTIRDRGSSALIIMCSIDDSPEFRNRCLEAGADYFVSKRTDLERMPDLILAHIARS